MNLRAAAALLVFAAACTHDVTVGAPLRQVLDVPPDHMKQLDVLFVVDPAAGTAAQRTALITATSDALFGELAKRLDNQLPDLHFAVISSEVAAPDPMEGSLPAGCDVAGTGQMTACAGVQSHWLADAPNADGSRYGNHPGVSFGDAIACLADVAPSTCAVSQPIAAVLAALGDGAPGLNAGFVRDGALLLVVFLTARDDCSAESATFYKNGEVTTPVLDGRCFAASTSCAGADCAVRDGGGLISIADAMAKLEDIKSTDRTKLMVAGVFAPPGPVSLFDRGGGDFVPSSACAGFDAAPAFRLAALAGAFSSRYAYASVCDQDPTAELNRIASAVAGVMSADHCVMGPVPPHAACRAFTAVDVDGEHTPILACGDTLGRDCFTVEPDDLCAGTESGLSASPTAAITSGAHFVVECAEPDGL